MLKEDVANHEAFTNGEIVEKSGILGELDCGLICNKEQNYKCLIALHRSVPRVLFQSAKHFVLGLLDSSHLFVPGSGGILIEDELVLHMGRAVRHRRLLTVFLFFNFFFF